MNYKNYLFDFDGTLVDSMPCFSRKMLNVLEKSGVEYPKDIVKTMTTLGTVDIAKYFHDILHVEWSVDEIIRQMDAYALVQYRDCIPLKEGVREYLQVLKKKGCSLNILTASPHHLLDPCLKRNGIWELFDHIWSCDDFGLAKSDVNIYREAARRMGTEVSEVVFFDDNVGAVGTAMQAGMYTIGVYDLSSEEYTEQIKAMCKQYIKTMSGMDEIQKNGGREHD